MAVPDCTTKFHGARTGSETHLFFCIIQGGLQYPAGNLYHNERRLYFLYIHSELVQFWLGTTTRRYPSVFLSENGKQLSRHKTTVNAPKSQPE